MALLVRPQSFGGPEVLLVDETEVPTPGAGEVVVEVRSAGVNPIDWKLYSGAFHSIDDGEKDAAGLAAPLPRLGLECAGVITAVGVGVDGVHPGDEVIVYPVTAAYADYVVAPASSLLPKPAALDWPEAGGLMLAGTTAAHALHAAGVVAGDTVLIHGAAGGVGLMAVQLARIAGAAVVATASERNHDLLRELGALPVAYGEGVAERIRAVAPQGVTAAVDTAGTDEALDVSLALVQDPSRIASIAGSDRRAQTGISVLGYGPGQDAGTEIRSAARSRIVELAGSGQLRVVVASTFPLVEAARAHELGQSSHRAGKIVLLPRPSADGDPAA